MVFKLEINTPDIRLIWNYTKTNPFKALRMAQKLLSVATHFNTDRNVEPMDYGYPSYSAPKERTE